MNAMRMRREETQLCLGLGVDHTCGAGGDAMLPLGHY